MKRSLFVICLALSFPVSGWGASWKTTDSELVSLTGMEIFMAENGAGTGNNWIELDTIKDYVVANIPTLNQNTTGTAGGLSAQYIDWSASSGGSSIANKPPIGTAAALDYGTDIGDAVRLGDAGTCSATQYKNETDCVNAAGTWTPAPGLPFSISYNDLTDKPTIPADVGDLTDTEGLLGGGGTLTITESADDPSFSTMNTGDLIISVASGDLFYKSATGGYVFAGGYTVDTDTTPNSFSFTDQTDVELSTEITSELVQITGINAATAVSASGGTAAICTSANIVDCGTFGTSPGNITNNQYIAARHTSSSSAETAVNTVVTIGGVSDTFTSTTASEESSDIVLYLNADSATTGQSPTIGIGPITIGASVTAVSGQVGNALQSTSTYSSGEIIIPQGNVPLSAGTLGMWLYRVNNNEGYLVSLGGVVTGSTFYLKHYNGGLEWYYRGGHSDASIALETWTFVEIAWDNANTSRAIRVNGGTWVESTAATGTAPTLANVVLQGVANVVGVQFDQIIMSNVYKKDLYAIRNDVSF